MIDPADVSAVLVTRGDVDMTAVVNSMPFDDVVVWNNGARDRDLACYGRFAGIAEAKNEYIYVQDDDILVPIPALLRAFQPGTDTVFANKKPEEEWRFLGIGALFHRDLADCFDRYLDLYGGIDADFCRVADVIFAYQHPYRSEWFGYAELEWSRAPNRMYLQDGHYEVRERARDRTRAFPGNTQI